MKRLLQAAWRSVAPAVRPVRTRFEAIVEACVARVVDDRAPGLVARAVEPAVAAGVARGLEASAGSGVLMPVDPDLTGVLDALLAEQFRLQSQLDDLRRRVEALAPDEPAPWATARRRA